VQVVVTDSPVCVTQQVIKLLLFNFRFRHLYYVRQPKPAKGRVGERVWYHGPRQTWDLGT